MSCSTGTDTWEPDCEMSSSDSDDDVLGWEIETIFNKECGRFPFERVYIVVDSGQLHSIFVYGNILFIERVSLYLLENLYKHDCPYANVTAAIINLYSASLSDISPEEMLREFAVTLKKPLVNVCDGINYKYHNRRICIAIAVNKLVFLKVLVRYGVLRPDKSETRVDLDYYSELIHHYIQRIAVPHGPLFRYLPEVVDDHTDAIEDRLISLYRNVRSNPELRSKLLRKQTVVMILHALSFLRDASDAVAECMKLYFDATTENFVTVREMEELIDIPQQSLHLFDEHRIEKGYQLLRSVFPDSDILQPRTLKHLSRCAVRTHLTERGVLPEVVAKLGIPNPIKKYILISKAGS